MRRKPPIAPFEAALRTAALGDLAQIKVCKVRADTNAIKRSHEELAWRVLARPGRDTMLKLIANGDIPVYAIRVWPRGTRLYEALQMDPSQRISISRPRAGELL
jgi:hypothetical protein